MKVLPLVRALVVLLLVPGSLLAGGQRELPDPDKGSGILLIQIRSHRGTTQRWTRTLHYRHAESGKRHQITLSASSETRIIQLPPGEYRLHSSDRLRDGQLDQSNDSFRPPAAAFNISTGEITVFPCMVFYYDTGLPHQQARSAALPAEMSRYRQASGRSVDNSIINAFYLIQGNASLEREILDEIIDRPGADAWTHRAVNRENIAYWPGNPRPLSIQEPIAIAPEPEQAELPRRFSPTGSARIAVLEFQNHTGRSMHDALARAVKNAVSATLASVETFEVVTVSEEIAGSPSEQAQRLQVDALVWGAVRVASGSQIEVNLSLYDRLQDELLISQSAVGAGVLDALRVSDELVEGVVRLVDTGTN